VSYYNESYHAAAPMAGGLIGETIDCDEEQQVAFHNEYGATGTRVVEASLTLGNVVRVEVAQESNDTTVLILSDADGRSSLSIAQVS
jgi:hypothetical protein